MFASQPQLIATSLPSLVPMEGRSPGVHVSDIIHDIAVRRGHYQSGNDPDKLFWEFGNCIEEGLRYRLKAHYPDTFVDIGELELDDIYGTPDLFSEREVGVIDGWELDRPIPDHCVHEVKATKMSARHAFDPDPSAFDDNNTKSWKYWAQIKSYCYMLGVSVGCLHVLFVNGRYGKGPFGDCMWGTWLREFTEMELRTHWAQMVSVGKRLRAGGDYDE